MRRLRLGATLDRIYSAGAPIGISAARGWRRANAATTADIAANPASTYMPDAKLWL